MDKGANLKIVKLEKGPLQRFKNQNLLLKKFGEVGLQVYKVITGKRTTEELRSDLDMDGDLFTAIIAYMEEAGMVELKQVESETEALGKEEILSVEKESEKKEAEIKAKEKAITAFETAEEIKPDETRSEEIKFEERKEEEGETEKREEEKPEEETPSEEKTEEEKTEEMIEEKIEPIGIEEITEEATLEEQKREEEKTEEEKPEEETPSEEKTEEEKTEEKTDEAIEPESGIGFSNMGEEITPTEGDEELSPVEKMISEKYGEVGLKVYELIDGQRSAEEIMKETGLTESKLVEILDFMDAQGIIKLEYPKGKKEQQAREGPVTPTKDLVTPILDQKLEDFKELSPILVPVKAPSDIIKDILIKADIIGRFGEKGTKIYDAIAGKNDIIDIALKTNVPLYEVERILNFLRGKKAIFLNPLFRTDIIKKYGDEGYSVYKKYGKEGLMLYELIGKELTIKQMADKVTQDKQKAADMFLFIYQVLRIDLPLDKDMLYKQLGI